MEIPLKKKKLKMENAIWSRNTTLRYIPAKWEDINFKRQTHFYVLSGIIHNNQATASVYKPTHNW